MIKTGAEILVEYLIKQGVQYIAGVTGHGCVNILDAVRMHEEKGEIKFIQVKQEMAAVHMADGYYRATGKPMAVITSIGPGGFNTSIGIATCYVDSTPVFVITGDTHVRMRGTGVLQEIERVHDSDYVSCMRPISKRAWRVESVEQLPSIIRRAYNEMMSGRKGPVVLSFPMDVQADSMEFDIEKEKVQACNTEILGTEESISQAADMLINAQRPLMIVGGGVLYGRKYDAVIQLAEALCMPVITTMAGKSAFPEDHPLYAFHAGSRGTDVGNHLARNADVVLALGCRFSDQTTSSYRKGATFNFPDTKLIQVDIDTGEIGKNYPVDVGIFGDANSVAIQLLDALKRKDVKRNYVELPYYQEIQDEKQKWLDRFASFNKPREAMTILQCVSKLNEVYPKNGYICTSSGSSQIQVFQGYHFKEPGRHITTGGFSTMGWSMTAAQGVALANPDGPVLSFTGDGDFMMTMQELATTVQYQLPVITVVLNNSGWMAIKELQVSSFGKDSMTFGNDFQTINGDRYMVDFLKMAEAFGIQAVRVDTPEAFGEAIQKAVADKKPILIEAMVSNAFPYGNGDNTGWWDMPVPYYCEKTYDAYCQGVKEEFVK